MVIPPTYFVQHNLIQWHRLGIYILLNIIFESFSMFIEVLFVSYSNISAICFMIIRSKLFNNISLFLLEPVGSVAPKINVADKLGATSARQGHVIDILCPAQSYPMASFRYFPITYCVKF